MNDYKSISEIKEQSLKEVLEQYTRYWYLFALGILLALVGAFIYLRYATRYYETSSTIIIKDEKKGGGAAELAAFSDLSFFANAFSDKIESELVILNSKSLIAKTIKALSLNVHYYYAGAIKTSELYDFVPLKVSFLDIDDLSENTIPQLKINIISNTSFSLEIEGVNTQVSYNFGDTIELPFGSIVVIPSLENPLKFESYFNRPIQVVYSSVEATASLVKGRLKLLHDGKNA